MENVWYVRSAGTGPEDAVEADVVELGRKLSGGTIDTREEKVLGYVRWWWGQQSYSSRMPFETAPLPIVVQVLQSTLDGHKAKVNFVKSKEGDVSSFVMLINPIAREGRTEATNEELAALESYLKLRVNNIGTEPSFWPMTPLRNWIWRIEESDVRDFPIDSDEFRKSELFLVPSATVDSIARVAGIAPTEARRLPLNSLVRAAADSSSEKRREAKEQSAINTPPVEELGAKVGERNAVPINQPDEVSRGTPTTTAKPSLNALMVDILSKHGESECVNWGVRMWQTKLTPIWGASPAISSVSEQPVYRSLLKIRESNRQQKVEKQTIKDDHGRRRSTSF